MTGPPDMFSVLAPPAPLPERLRPQSLDEVAGQEHLTGPEGALTRMLAAPPLLLSALLPWNNE